MPTIEQWDGNDDQQLPETWDEWNNDNGTRDEPGIESSDIDLIPTD